MPKITRLTLLILLFSAVLASGCAAHRHGEPVNRGWASSLIALEPPVESELRIVAVKHFRKRWCYEFETVRVSGRFCSNSDLGYAAGDVLTLTLMEAGR